MKNIFNAIVYLTSGLVLMSCSAKVEGSLKIGFFEGDDPGECEDDADNDRNGLFDCDDPNCKESPACKKALDGNTSDQDQDSDSVETETESDSLQAGDTSSTDVSSDSDSDTDDDLSSDGDSDDSEKNTDNNSTDDTSEDSSDSNESTDDIPTDDTDVDTMDSSESTDGTPTDDTANADTENHHGGDALRLLFIGNSFTGYGQVPGTVASTVQKMATSMSWPTPIIDLNNPGGEDLTGHMLDQPETLELVDKGDWDFVVLQGQSLEATDNDGDPETFKSVVTWFYDRIKASSPGAEVILYETWAYHPDNSIYLTKFADPEEMMSQIRDNYNDAADNYVPNNASFVPSTDIRVAPVGDAWEHHMAEDSPLMLYGDDLKHESAYGQYLSGLVIYSTIYKATSTGVSNLDIDSAASVRLQQAANWATGRKSK